MRMPRKGKTLAMRKKILKARVASLELEKYLPMDYKPNVSLAKYSSQSKFV
jgi:hypothetical protein